MNWFTSDLHYSHKNLILGVSNWKDKSGCRNFNTIEEHDNTIVNNINKYVKEDHKLWVLGDWSFGGIENIWNFRKRINCKNIYFCTGNHDHHIKNNKVLPNCHKEDWFGKIIDGPPTRQFEHSGDNYMSVYAQELFTDVQPMYEIQIHGHRMTLCHYAMRTWYYHNKGSWNLHGHSHSSLEPIGKQLDVGVDEAFKRFGEYRPFKFNEIQKIMNNKEFKQVDSHSPSTNAQ